MARIEFTDAEGELRRYEVPATAAGIVMGRSPSCNVVLPSHSVGRNHGRITCEGGSFHYVDLGSVNGTFLNGRKVTAPARLQDGDEIRCGDVVLHFRVGSKITEARAKTAAPAPAPAPEVPDRTLRDGEAEKPARAPEAPRRPAPAAPLPPTAPAPAVQPAQERPRADGVRPVADAVAMGELSRVRKENAALRAEVQALQGRLSSNASDSADVAVLRRQLEEARSSTSDDEVKRLKAVLADAERHAREAESRAAMANSSLESIHTKYMEAREESRHVSSLLERTRSEAQDREIEVLELREKAGALQAQIEASRGRGVESAEEVKALKVRLTQKDRETESLRRELDSREYDLKTLREENERLEEYCQSDSGRQHELERKARNLEAVIEENRNLLAELRRTLSEKERDLREVRLGVGIADLEQEKQRLLDDYHRKSSELDTLRADLSSAKADLAGAAADREALEGRIRQLEEAAKAKRLEREDISDHPEYRAKVREAEALADTVAARDRDAEGLRREVADGAKALEATRADAARAVEAAKAEAAKAIEAARAEAARAEAAKAAVVTEQPAAPHGLADAVESLLDSLVLLQSGMRDLEAAIGDSPAAEVEEAVASLRDLRRVVSGEAEALKTRMGTRQEGN
ncbi:MAG: FHA domain-containing protein [Deltaproteobacteria bacterium]|nr:FHA domain-containing protein [Deltaproteobacteria bacterium]